MAYVIGFPILLSVWFSLAYVICMLLFGGSARSARIFDQSAHLFFLAALVGLALALHMAEGWSPSLSLDLPQIRWTPLPDSIQLLLCLLALPFGWMQYRLERGLLRRRPSSVVERPVAETMLLLPILVIILAAVLEELIWRGYLIPALMSIWSLELWLALFISSVAFSIHHVYFGLHQIGIKAAQGMLWGGVFLFSASLLPAIIAHIAFNLFIFYHRAPGTLPLKRNYYKRASGA